MSRGERFGDDRDFNELDSYIKPFSGYEPNKFSLSEKNKKDPTDYKELTFLGV